MSSKNFLTLILGIIGTLLISFFITIPAFGYDNAELLPTHKTPVIDLAKSLNESQRIKLEESLNQYEEETGWKIKVLTQFENTPGTAIKEFWDIDETTLILVADPRGGNLLNFNVGDAYFALLPRIFWVELQTRYGNQFYVRDNGESEAIIDSINAVKTCLNKGGCEVVPGLPREQWIWTLGTSILGGVIAGVAAVPRKQEELIAWKWLLLMSPLWIMLFGIFGIAPIITRTNEILPLSRNIVSFITCLVISYLLTRKATLGSNHSTEN
ncbi:TPM domain-containing protein [Prochlorococcus marinus]|uniref:TPM domain-containing protein n=1 Tax=Prochlorococcus marinus TaxID=1219 RepID=UPI0022B494C9|nr:TPM domain-containing protein [Prochlorococcus marinus]